MRLLVGAAVASLFAFFVDPSVSAFVFFFSFVLGMSVLFPPQHQSMDGLVGCFVIQRGGNPFSSDSLGKGPIVKKL